MEMHTGNQGRPYTCHINCLIQPNSSLHFYDFLEIHEELRCKISHFAIFILLKRINDSDHEIEPHRIPEW